MRDKTSEHLYPPSPAKNRLRQSYCVLEMYKMYENPEKNQEKFRLSVDLWTQFLYTR